MRRGLLKDIDRIFEMATDMTGCMHPDEREECRNWIEEVKGEVLLVMKYPMPPTGGGVIKRAVKRVDTRYEEHTGKKSWWRVKVNTVTLECGHTKTYRGGVYPKRYSRCQECEALHANPR